MNEQLERGGLSSSSAPSGPLAEVGSGASSRPTGPAQRSSSAATPRGRRIGLATATIAALGTLAIAIAVAGGLGGAKVAPAAVTVAATQVVAQPAPTDQVIVDTVYVHAPAPTAQPALIVPSKVKATPKPPIRVVHVVPGAGGESEGGDQAETGGGDD
jgi:hypothetical protein